MLHKNDRTNYVSVQWPLENTDSKGWAVLQTANQVSLTSKLNLTHVFFHMHGEKKNKKKNMQTTQALFFTVKYNQTHSPIESKQDELLYYFSREIRSRELLV